MTRSLGAALQPHEGNVAEYVRSLAQANGVTFVRTAADEFAEVANRLVGDDLPPPNETQDLLVALYRAGLITDKESNDLLIKHVQQRAP
jgi:hypothetical protein